MNNDESRGVKIVNIYFHALTQDSLYAKIINETRVRVQFFRYSAIGE